MSTQPCIPQGSLNRVPALIGWGKSGNVTSAGWQVTLCDPIRHVSSHGGAVLVAQTAIRFFTFTLSPVGRCELATTLWTSGVTIGRARRAVHAGPALWGPKICQKLFLKSFFGEEGALLKYFHAGPLQPCYATAVDLDRFRVAADGDLTGRCRRERNVDEVCSASPASRQQAARLGRLRVTPARRQYRCVSGQCSTPYCRPLVNTVSILLSTICIGF